MAHGVHGASVSRHATPASPMMMPLDNRFDAWGMGGRGLTWISQCSPGYELP